MHTSHIYFRWCINKKICYCAVLFNNKGCMSTSNVRKVMKDKEIEYVDLRFTDPRGKLQHVTLSTVILWSTMLCYAGDTAAPRQDFYSEKRARVFWGGREGAPGARDNPLERGRYVHCETPRESVSARRPRDREWSDVFLSIKTQAHHSITQC